MRLRYLLRPREVTGLNDARVLSVYRDHGIVPKESRDDNFNKTPLDLSRYQEVRAGDLVINKMKAWQGSLGISDYHGIVSPDYLVCALSSAVHGRYLHHLLRSSMMIAEYGKRSKGIRPSQWRLYWEDLAEISIDLPPLEEQRRIADFLDAETAHIDQLIQSFGELKRLLRQRRMSAVYSLVTKVGSASSKPSGLPWVHEIPSHWRVARVGFFAKMGSGHTPSRSRLEWWRNSKHGWITTGEVAQVRDDRREVINETREKISDLGLANSSAVLHPKGTVVLCRTASAGYSAIMGEEMATSQDFVTWTCGKQLDPFYLLWCLRAMRPDLLGRLATGSTHKTIYVPDLQMLKIPVPPIEEQREIVRSVRASNDTVDALADAVDAQVNLLGERRRAVVTAAITGELDVTTARRLS